MWLQISSTVIEGITIYCFSSREWRFCALDHQAFQFRIAVCACLQKQWDKRAPEGTRVYHLISTQILHCPCGVKASLLPTEWSQHPVQDGEHLLLPVAPLILEI